MFTMRTAFYGVDEERESVRKICLIAVWNRIGNVDCA